MNGSTMERELLAVLRGHDFVTTRTPGSGTGDWDMPDALAARDGVLLACELKSGENPRNIMEAEADALRRVADGFWAAALAGVRYKRDRTFYFVPIDAMARTDAGNYSIPNDPERLPWVAALPYTKGSDGVRPIYQVVDEPDSASTTDVPRVDFATDDEPPDFTAWLDALTAAQQGFHVRQGLVDADRSATRQPDADWGNDV